MGRRVESVPRMSRTGEGCERWRNSPAGEEKTREAKRLMSWARRWLGPDSDRSVGRST